MPSMVGQAREVHVKFPTATKGGRAMRYLIIVVLAIAAAAYANMHSAKQEAGLSQNPCNAFVEIKGVLCTNADE